MTNSMTGGMFMLAILVALLTVPMVIGHYTMSVEKPEVHASIAQ